MSAALRRWSALPPNTQAGLLVLANAFLMMALVVVVREVGKTLPTMMIVLLRNLFSLAILVPFVLARPAALGTRALGLHMWRGGLTLFSMTAYYWSYANLPLAETTALIFTMPLFLIVISVLVLGERVRWRRTTATVAGFLGVLVIVQPGDDMEWGLLAALFVGFVDAILGLIVKRAAMRDGLLTVMVYMVLCTLLFVTPVALYRWQTPTVEEALLMLAIAAISTVSQTLIVTAWRVGEATAVAPINYVQIVLIGISGFLVYGEIPGLWSMAGAAIIAASTFYIVWREAQLRGRRADPGGRPTGQADR